MEAGTKIPTPMRVLVLEDSATDAELALRELRKLGVPFESRQVDTRAGFEAALRDFKPDLILSDFSLPASFDGLSALDIARRALPDVPYVFVSGTIGEDRAVEVLRRGATDYVLKDRLARLVPVVKRALEEARERVARRKAEAELEETRSRLDSVIGSLRDIVWSYSLTEKRLVYINPAVEEICGTPAAAFYADPRRWFETVIHPDDRARVRAEREAGLAARHFDMVYRVVLPDGSLRWIQDRAKVFTGADGTALRIDGLARDITEARTQAERITRLNRMLEVLSGINTTIVRVKDRDELFREACRLAVDNGKFRLAWIGLLEPDSARIRPHVQAGEDRGLLGELELNLHEGETPRGASGLAMRSRSPVVVNDTAADSALDDARSALSRGFHSFIVLPLFVEGKPVGQLALYAAEAGYFDREEIRLMEELAGDISFALENMAKAERLDYLAYYDSLTGVPNRSLFHEQVVQLAHSISGDEQGLAVIMIDVERFRLINESLGMAAGDVLLKAFAERLSAAVGEPGTVARISADRFAIALVPVRGATDVAHMLEGRILSAMNAPFRVREQRLHIAAKAGIAVYPSDGDEPSQLLLNAEAALAQAKRSGERYAFYAPEMNARVAGQLRLENELRTAALAEQFVLYYQPRVDLNTGRICGLEALMRWNHPRRGLVAPNDFIPVLEQTGMIVEAGRWALQRAALDRAAWQARGIPAPRIAVNVSPVQLRRADFVEEARRALGEHAAHGGAIDIDIEVTESMLMEDIGGNTAKLAALRRTGIGIALDDFGTGYSSLSWLARLPLDALKIDRSFITGLSGSPEQMAIVSAVISLARALNLKVVAEGVETEEQVKLLRLLRCDEAQGYFYSPALPPEKVAALLADDVKKPS